MQSDQAKSIAHLIIDTWPTYVVKPYIWTNALNELDHSRAITTYETLRDSDERAPSIARFLAVYHAADWTLAPPQTTPSWWLPNSEVCQSEHGKRIAWNAYVAACEHPSPCECCGRVLQTSREPQWERFAGWFT